ncbi:SNF2-related protein [Nitzschia inconspicua]|uniref:SNF2-related protein n=1 Tax=Nitzschia inconspicua TaxID=303405 RepID=A0A9K3LIB7_9STRA|nr:SNF2-related protein [Nitzschia inconspicua]
MSRRQPPAARSFVVEEQDSKMPPPSRTNKGNGNNNNDEISDEAMLASTLGTRIENMDEYESNVLRDAELMSTPRLMMPLHALSATSSGTSSDSATASLLHLGFPSLHTLTPSRNVHTDLPHVQTVLQQLRNRNTTTKTEKDYLKEQMLLSLLHVVTGDPDLAVRPQQEARQEQERKKGYRNNGHTKQQLSTALKTTTTKNGHISVDLNSSNRTTDVDGDMDDPSQRLEQIKQGTKVVRFATNVSAAQVLSPSAAFLRSKRRKSMQERRGVAKRDSNDNKNDPTKSQSNQPNRDIDPDKLTLEELEALQQRKERLKKLREEREQRRKQQQQKQQRKKLKPKKRRLIAKQKEDTSDEEEFEFTGDDNINQKQGTVLKKNRKRNDDGNETTATTTATTIIESQADDNENQNQRNLVVCPLCQQAVSVPSIDNQVQVDSILAQHMSSCQSTGRPSRRRGRKHPPTTCSTNNKYNNERNMQKVQYKEASESDNNDDGDDNAQAMEEEYTASDDMIDENDDDDVLEADEDCEVDSVAGTKRKRSTNVGLLSHTRETVDDWDENDYEDRVAGWIEHGLEDMKSMKERDTQETPPGEQVYEGGLVIPAWINDRLFPYQRTGLQWMWELHCQQNGGILGDEMGLGKTIQVVSFLGAMAASRKLKSILIISPATMLQHWLQELAKWAPGIRRILIHQSGDSQAGPFQSQGRSTITTKKLADMDNWLKTARRNRLFEIIDEEDLETRDPASFCGTGYAFVTTFENVRRNEEIWTNHKWNYVVMDEAQKIRNPGADITLVCKRLKTPHRLALSGTPIQNDLRELWSIFDFVFPGRLGTLPVFEVEFADPIKRGGYANATPMQVQLAYRCALLLKDLINPYLLRRLKKDIKEVKRMPGKKEHVLFCRLSDQQREMYEAFLRSDYVRNVVRGSAQLLGAITMLQKICNHPDLVCPPDKTSVERFIQNGYFNENEMLRDLDEEDYASEGDLLDVEADDNGLNSFVKRSGKLDVLSKILPLWKKQGHRVLLFCQWIKMLDLIMRFVEHQGWKYGRLDGKTNIASRQRLVNRFNEDDSYFIMLCTTKTGGVGLNLTGANRIILYDPNWNPSVDAQARERSWRFGQEREVTVYRLVVAGSVEEKIYQRQIFKQAISNSVLTDQRQGRFFSQKDLKDLFTLKADKGSIMEGAGGMTETTQMTRGLGYVDPDDNEQAENQKDDGEIMKRVLQSQGIAGVFNHDIVEGNGVTKKASVQEMEDKAKSIAREALRNLSRSVVPGQDTFNPETRFAGLSSGSSGILSSIADRNSEMNGTSLSKNGETVRYTKLLKDLCNYIRLNTPTTDDILEEFSSQVSSFDAAVFRRLLKSVASLQNGRWRLK